MTNCGEQRTDEVTTRRQATTMTAGQEALREAARLESARVYGRVITRGEQPPSVMAARAEAEIEAAWFGLDSVTDSVKAGWTTKQIMGRYGAAYREVREARKDVMGGAA